MNRKEYFKYDSNDKIHICFYMLTKIENDFKNLLYSFETDYSKNSNTVRQLLESTNEIKESIDIIKEHIFGFNFTIFYTTMAIVHTSILIKKKKVLHELENKAINHMLLVLISSLTSGYIFGHLFGRSFKLNRRISEINRNIDYQINLINKKYL